MSEETEQTKNAEKKTAKKKGTAKFEVQFCNELDPSKHFVMQSKSSTVGKLMKEIAKWVAEDPEKFKNTIARIIQIVKTVRCSSKTSVEIKECK